MHSTGNEYALRTLEFVERVGRLEDYSSICKEIEQELLWYGLTSVSIMKIPGPMCSLEDSMFMNTRPSEYLDHYVENNYIVKDPVVTELSLTEKSYTWNDIRQKRILNKKQKYIMDEGRDFEATDGLIVPIHTLSGEVSIFSPCGENPNLSDRARCSLELIGMYSYESLKRAVIKKKKTEIIHEPLTPREREVMLWVASGKTDDEIADILTISTTTVASHVQNSKRKLNTFKRTYAVVQAIKLGEISL